MSTEPSQDPEEPGPTGTGGSHSAPRPVPQVDPPTQPQPDAGDELPPDVEATRVNPVVPPSRPATEPAPTETAQEPATQPVEPADDQTTSAPTTEPTRPMPLTTDETTTRTIPQSAATPQPPAEPDRYDSLDEDGWVTEPAPRTAAHLWSIVLTLVLTPVAWFLLSDGAQRTFYSLAQGGDVNMAGLLSLVGGLLALILIMVTARWSGLGAMIIGALVTLAGVAFLVFPSPATQWLEENRDVFLVIDDGFGTNVYNYVLDTARSGLVVLFGVIILMTGVVSHGARRQGRREGRAAARRESSAA